MEKADKTDNSFKMEFVINRANAVKVRTAMQKIKTLFNTSVELGKIAPKAHKGDEARQWIAVASSTKEDGNAAKEYILALASPEITVTLEQSEAVARLREEDLLNVEYHSHAVLKWDEGKHAWEISGAQLAVVLAQSMIDSYLSTTDKFDDTIVIEEEEVRSENTRPNPLDLNNSSVPPAFFTLPVSSASTPSVNPPSKKLHYPHPDNGFEQQLSRLSGEQPLQYPTRGVAHSSAPQQFTTAQCHLLSKSLQFPLPMDTDQATASRPARHAVSSTTTSTQGQNTVQHLCDTSTAHGPAASPTSTTSPISTSSASTTSPISTSSASNTSPISASPPSDPMEVCGVGTAHGRTGRASPSPQARAQLDYLRNVGLSCNYCPEDVNTALTLFDMEDVIVPSHFLDILNEIKSARHRGAVQLHHVSSSSSGGAVGGGGDLHNASKQGQQDVVVISDDDDRENTEVMKAGPERASHRQAPLSSSMGATSQLSQPQAARRVRDCSPRSGHQEQVQVATGAGDCHQEDLGSHLRYIVIDGSNVAMTHGNGKFSSLGLEICINYFRERGHPKVVAFVSESCRYAKGPISYKERQILERLNQEGWVKFTPARRINGRQITAYEDRFILNLAMKEDAVVVSNDQFRDLCEENTNYLHIVEKRLLQYMFVDDHFMPPDDPLGRGGPSLDQFLMKETSTSSIPKRPSNSHVKGTGRGRGPMEADCNRLGAGFKPNPSLPRPTMSGDRGYNTMHDSSVTPSPPGRSHTETERLFDMLTQIFPDQTQQQCVRKVLRNHREETDMNRLTNFCMSALSL